MNWKPKTRNEADVVEMLRHADRGASIYFTNHEGTTMRAKRSNHAVHVRTHGTSVRATATYDLPHTRRVEMKQGDYAKWSASRLKAECKARGLKVGGTKAQLNARLVDNDASRGEEE